MKLFRICKINLIQWRINPKYLAVALYLVLYMWNSTRGYVSYCRDVGYSIRPWLFPLLPGSPQFFLFIYIAFVLLLSDYFLRPCSGCFLGSFYCPAWNGAGTGVRFSPRRRPPRSITATGYGA